MTLRNGRPDCTLARVVEDAPFRYFIERAQASGTQAITRIDTTDADAGRRYRHCIEIDTCQ
jgi:hypothetical protein